MSGRPPGTVQGWARVSVTMAFVVVPFAGLAAAVWLSWGHGLNLADVLLAVAFYVRWPTLARLESRRRCPSRGEPEPALQPGERRTGRAAASRLSPLPAGGDRIR